MACHSDTTNNIIIARCSTYASILASISTIAMLRNAIIAFLAIITLTSNNASFTNNNINATVCSIIAKNNQF